MGLGNADQQCLLHIHVEDGERLSQLYSGQYDWLDQDLSQNI